MKKERTRINRPQIYFCFCLYVVTAGCFLLSLYPLQANIYIPFFVPYILGAFLVVLVLSTIIYLDSNVKMKGKRFSSGRTAFYTFFIPLSFLAFICADILILLLAWNRPKDFASLIIGMGAVVVLFFFIYKYKNLKVVSVEGRYIFLSDFFKIECFEVSDIVKVWRPGNYLYEITIKKDNRLKRYRMLLPISDHLNGSGIQRIIRKFNLPGG